MTAGGHTWPRVWEQEGQGRRQLAVSKTVTLQRALARGQSRGRQDEGGEPGGGYTGPGLASLRPRGDPASPAWLHRGWWFLRPPSRGETCMCPR